MVGDEPSSFPGAFGSSSGFFFVRRSKTLSTPPSPVAALSYKSSFSLSLSPTSWTGMRRASGQCKVHAANTSSKAGRLRWSSPPLFALTWLKEEQVSLQVEPELFSLVGSYVSHLFSLVGSHVSHLFSLVGSHNLVTIRVKEQNKVSRLLSQNNQRYFAGIPFRSTV